MVPPKIVLTFLIIFLSFISSSQTSSFTLTVTDSLNKRLTENQFTDLAQKPALLKLNFTRASGDKNDYEIFVLQYNEKKKFAQLVAPATPRERKYFTIDDTVRSRTIKLVTIELQPGDTANLAVFASTGYNSFYYTLTDIADTSWKKYSWLLPKRDSSYHSFMRFLQTDLQAIAALDELEKLAEVKHDNLIPLESDLELALKIRQQKLIYKSVVSFIATQPDKKTLTTFSFFNPQESYTALKWDQPRGYLFQPGKKSELDYMVEEAATRHLNLMASRGVRERITDRLKFSLREMIETLETLPGKVGLLLYSSDDKGLKILYADNKRKTDTVNVPLARDRLNELNVQLQSLLNPEGSRGLKITSNTRPGSIDSLSRIIGGLLLPGKFDLSDLDHLVIIPSLNIGTFPFAMLPLKDSTMLIDKMSYSIVPSINEFIITGQLSKKTYQGGDRRDNDDNAGWSGRNRFLFVGSPPANVIGNYKFEALPGTKLEIETISKNISSKTLLLGKDAVKPAVVKAMKDADIIYFATHGIADATDPLNKSFILLSGKNDSAILTAKEIQELELKSSMVILSACETGLGKSHEGGTIGLARAFEIAGAKNVLMTLWPVSDSKTPVLMKFFFESLEVEQAKENYFPHEALRKAILKFKSQEKDPRYWAAFSVFGIPG